MKKKYKKIAVGGTFDKFHSGHKKLLSTAFEMGEEVLIGITSDRFVSKKNHDIEPFSFRCKRVREYVLKFETNFNIIEIFDSCGTADVDSLLDAIVVSHETEKSAEYINEIRFKNGLNLLDIIVIDWILAADGNPISSTRIRKGEIDGKGKLL
ncbi:MAG: phosphopantetheine adenylyltransferase [Methanosphaera sp. rholeuAM6]|nr:MAG: phosphopantetheine adenylyltransferase [Methanosphaera sp. rholeuAM6]